MHATSLEIPQSMLHTLHPAEPLHHGARNITGDTTVNAPHTASRRSAASRCTQHHWRSHSQCSTHCIQQIRCITVHATSLEIPQSMLHTLHPGDPLHHGARNITGVEIPQSMLHTLHPADPLHHGACNTSELLQLNSPISPKPPQS